MVGGEVCQWPRLHDLDGSRTSTRHQPKPHVDDAQEISGEDPAWGADRAHGLRDEEQCPTLTEGRHRRDWNLPPHGSGMPVAP